MNCMEALPLIHEYMDGELESSESIRLKEHLLACPACRMRLQQFEKMEALVGAWPAAAVPEGLSERIMAALPPVKQENRLYRWIRKHPAASVAAVFFVVMISSFLSTWDDERDLVVKGADMNALVIEGHTVRVPAGSKVAGSLTIENGTIEVDGEVEGDVVVIDGSLKLASTAHISGHIQEIDETLGWIWYKMNQWVTQVSDTE